RRDIVDAVQKRARIKNCNNPVAGISAAPLHDLTLACGKPSAFRHSELQADIGLRARAVCDEGFLAGELHHHFATAGFSEKCRDDFEIQYFDTGAEAAADKRFNHPNARGIHIKAAGEHKVEVVADLRHRLHGEAA